MDRVGIEPTHFGLKVRYSTAELPVRDSFEPMQTFFELVDPLLEIFDLLTFFGRTRSRGSAIQDDLEKTTAVVLGEDPGASKLTKATELGIPVLDEAQFVHLLETGELPGSDVLQPENSETP